jgi:hypothetical protein
MVFQIEGSSLTQDPQVKKHWACLKHWAVCFKIVHCQSLRDCKDIGLEGREAVSERYVISEFGLCKKNSMIRLLFEENIIW